MDRPQSIAAIAKALESGRTSAVAITEEAIAAAVHTNPRLRSFITISADHALNQARQADVRRKAGRVLGLLDGIPYAAKDMFETSGIRTTGGSKVLRDHVPDRSAAAIRMLDDGGAVMVGKTNLHEFAYGATGENCWAGTTVNPHDETRLAGGSSSGSAAAVAAGIVPFSLGTDTGGSVRVPAALCGIAGYKPSFDLMSLEGVIPYCWSLDHGGILAATTRDIMEVAWQLTKLRPEPAPTSLRVGIIEDWEDRCEPAVRAAYRAAMSLLEKAGASFQPITLPDQSEARTISLTIQLAETLTYHGPNLARARDDFGADMLSGMVLGQFLSAESYIQCKRVLEIYKRDFARAMQSVDILLTPACPITAPRVGTVDVELAGQTMPLGNALTLFTSFFNLVGVPAAVVPMPTERGALPVAVQLVGAFGADARLLAIAAMLEEASGN